MRKLWLLAAVTTLSFAEDVSVDQLAKIQAEQDAAMKKIAEQHGNRSLGQMDNSERKQLFEEQNAATRDVLQSNGVSAKDYTRAKAKLGREDRAAVDAQAQHLSEKKPAAAAPEAKKEIPIEYGVPRDKKDKTRRSKASKADSSRSERRRRRDAY